MTATTRGLRPMLRRGHREGIGADFRRLWNASAVSSVGDGVTLAAAPLLAATLTDDPRLISGGLVALTLPFVLFGLPAGLVADRIDLRRAMVAVDTARAVMLGGLAVALAYDLAGLVLLYACLFLVGTGEAFVRNAAQVLVPSVAPTHLLSSANARIIAAQEAGGGFVGPLLGGALFGLAVAVPFAVDAATFLCSAILVSRIRPLPPRVPDGTQPPRSGLLVEMLAGAAWLGRHHVLRTLALLSCLINVAASGALAVLVVLSSRTLQLEPFGYGALLACQALGAVLAAKLAPMMSSRFGREGALVTTAVGLAASGTLIASVPSPYPVGFALALFSAATVTWNVIVVVLRQTLVPQSLMGRVNSAYRLVAWAGLPLGAALGGVVAQQLGVLAVYAVEGVVMAAVAVGLLIGARRHWIARAVQVDGPIGHESVAPCEPTSTDPAVR